MRTQENTPEMEVNRSRDLAAEPSPLPQRRRFAGNGKRAHPQGPQQRFASALGWLSIGLGLAEVLAPRALSRLIGARYRPALFVTLGLRELASGIGILARPQPTGWLWSRVAGDLMDLSLLGTLFGERRSDRQRLRTAVAAVAGVTVLDVVCARQQSAARATPQSGAGQDAIHLTRTITIEASPEELYRRWRNLETLPGLLSHLESVRMLDEKRSHWVAKAPAGTRVEWDAEIVEDRPNELIAWRSLAGAEVDNSGSVRFEPATGGRGTILRVELAYNPPGGRLGAALAKLFGREPGQQIAVDLHRFKQIVETGYPTVTEGQSAGRSQSTSPLYDDLVRH